MRDIIGRKPLKESRGKGPCPKCREYEFNGRFCEQCGYIKKQ